MRAKMRAGDWRQLASALILIWLLAEPPSIVANQSTNAGSEAVVPGVSHTVLVAGWMEMIDNFFMQNRAWILTMGLFVVILGFALLYKGWK